MATLQKFKLLATQCGVVQSPTRSPRSSPIVNLRRKKTTLRMLLTRSSSRHQDQSQTTILPPLLPPPPPPEKKRDTLKDLFVSSPTAFDGEDGEKKEIGGKCEVYRMRLSGLGVEPLSGSTRPGWIGFRHRCLIRRAWRPMLVTIVEEEEEDDVSNSV